MARYYNIHTNFILKPISTILDDCIESTIFLHRGLDLMPIKEYIIHSLFLKFTGFLEQKYKCLIWETACHDMGVRRKLLEGDYKLGECSQYKAKQTVIATVREAIASIGLPSEICCSISSENLRALKKKYTLNPQPLEICKQKKT
jgi:hypothetical protein